MEGQETMLADSPSLMEEQEQQMPVEKQEAEEPELEKEKPQLEPEAKDEHIEPEQEKQLHSEPVKEPENTLTSMKPDAENWVESDPAQQPEVSPVKEPGVSPVKEPGVSPVKEPDVSPVKEPDVSPVKEPEVSPVKEAEVSPVKEPEVSPVKEPEVSPVKEPEVSPVKEAEVSPVKEAEVSPVKEAEVSPVKEAEVSPVKEAEVSPVKEAEVSPVKEAEVSPVKEAEVSPVKEPDVSPVKEAKVSPVKEPEVSPVKEPDVIPVKESNVSPVKEPDVSPVEEPGVSPVKEPEVSPVKEPDVSPVKEPEPEPEKQPEPECMKEPEAQQPKPSPVKQPEPEPEKQVDSGPKEVPEAGKQTEPVNQPGPQEMEAKEKQPETKQGAESKKSPEKEQGRSFFCSLGAKEEQEQQAPEDETPAPIIPGSLAFAILEDEHTKTALRTSHTLIILRGLPGSGKTRLASAIRDHYESLCTVISADHYNVKPESSSVEGHKAMDEALVACCTSGTAVVVIDDTNHTHGRLARLVDLAEQHQYYTLFLEPCTDWAQDVEQLVQKTRRGLDKSQIQALKGSLEEASMPLFFGWFLCPTIQDRLRSMAKDFLKTLQGLEAFKEHISDYTGEAEKEIDLEQHFQDKGMLHCTTKFCDYGKAEGSKEYAEQQVVKDRYGSMSELKLSALILTPRTLGARVCLTEEQLQLWPAGTEKEAVPNADLPAGSRAHVTLGCAEGVEPVQTGVDLLELLMLQQQGQEGEQVQDLDLGPLAYYGKGTWVLSLREASLAPACFCSYYGPKKEDGKKEGEKKKKFKCNLQ